MTDAIEKIADEMRALAHTSDDCQYGTISTDFVRRWADQIVALSARASAGEGSEWVMVPREPTWPMLCALHHGRNEPVADEQEKIASRYAAMLAAAPQPQAPEREDGERYALNALVWKRESTQEWVLEISGSINDTNFVVRHTEPLTTSPEDVAGLPSLYATPPAHGDGEGEFARVAASKPCPACGSYGPCEDAQKCMNTAITANFRGETFAQARQQLVNVLKAQKSWVTAYAESYVDEFADMATTRPAPETEWYCPTCKCSPPPVEVTYSEHHEVCGTFIGTRPAPEAQEARDEYSDLVCDLIALLPSAYYMDPPDGGDVSVLEQLKRMSKDAARYRWLREQDWFDGQLCVLRDPKKILTSGNGLGADCPSRNRLDEAIDAAMAARGEGES